MKQHKPSKHGQGSHRVAANHHRHVHKGVSAAVIVLWALIALASITAIGSYLDTRRQVHINNSQISVQADKVSYDDVGKYPFIPGKSKKYVIIHVTVKNNRTTTFNFAPVLQTYLLDTQGNRYNMSPASLSDPIAAGPIAPGQSRSGSLSYLVPTDVSTLTFHIDL